MRLDRLVLGGSGRVVSFLLCFFPIVLSPGVAGAARYGGTNGSVIVLTKWRLVQQPHWNTATSDTHLHLHVHVCIHMCVRIEILMHGSLIFFFTYIHIIEPYDFIYIELFLLVLHRHFFFIFFINVIKSHYLIILSCVKIIFNYYKLLINI